MENPKINDGLSIGHVGDYHIQLADENGSDGYDVFSVSPWGTDINKRARFIGHFANITEALSEIAKRYTVDYDL
jgi:hypothetical protein